MRCNYRLACLTPITTIGAVGLIAGFTLAGGISGAPAAASAELTSADVPPQSPTPGPLAIVITGQSPKAIIIGDPGGDGPGPKAVAAVAT